TTSSGRRASPPAGRRPRNRAASSAVLSCVIVPVRLRNSSLTSAFTREGPGQQLDQKDSVDEGVGQQINRRNEQRDDAPPAQRERDQRELPVGAVDARVAQVALDGGGEPGKEGANVLMEIHGLGRSASPTHSATRHGRSSCFVPPDARRSASVSQRSAA